MIDIMDKYILDHKIYIVKSQESESIDIEYNFLKHYKNKKYYYDILKTQNNYQIKSLYDFIYEHSIKCSHLLDKTINQFQGTEKINNELKTFINNDIAKEIFIINLIRVYFR